MTIGVGFNCDDGIVLCSDTQITRAGHNKYYESKIFTHQSPIWAVAFCYSGTPDLAKMFDSKLFTRLKAIVQPPDTEFLKAVVESTLDDLREEITKDLEGLSTLCGLSAPGHRLALCATEGVLISEVSSWTDVMRCVGIGDSSVLRYLQALLIRRWPLSSIQAIVLETYLVEQSKKYVDGCGGDTHIQVVRPNGQIEPFLNVYGLVQQMGVMEAVFSDFISRVYEPAKSVAEMDADLVKFGEKIKKIAISQLFT